MRSSSLSVRVSSCFYTIPTVVYISHNMEEVRMADYVIVMSNGTVEAAGTPEEVARASRTYRDYAAKQRVEVPA